MNELTRAFMDKNPIARFLSFNEKLVELRRSTELVAFLEEARCSGLPLTAAFAVDSWTCAIEVRQKQNGGTEMTGHLLDWVVGMAWRVQADVDEMLQAWPELSEFLDDLTEGVGEKRPKIDPQGP